MECFSGGYAFVGPRPERRYFIDLIRKENPDYDYIYLMRPGLTSMATLYNGYTDSNAKNADSFANGFRIFATAFVVFRYKNYFDTVVFILKGKKF